MEPTENNQERRRAALGVVLVYAVLLAVALPAGAADGGYTEGNGSVRHGRHHDDDAPIDMGSVAMAQVSEYPLGIAYDSIVSISAAPGRAGRAVITATGKLCTSHTAGVADSASVQVTVDGASAPGGSQSFSIPASQAAGQVCSPFTLTATFDQFSAQAHYISLDGMSSSGSASVSGASLSAILYPYHTRRR